MKNRLAPKTKPLGVLTFMWQTFWNQHVVFVMQDLRVLVLVLSWLKVLSYLEGHHHGMVTMLGVGSMPRGRLLCRTLGASMALENCWVATQLLGCGDLLRLCGLWRSACICATKCKCEWVSEWVKRELFGFVLLFHHRKQLIWKVCQDWSSLSSGEELSSGVSFWFIRSSSGSIHTWLNRSCFTRV